MKLCHSPDHFLVGTPYQPSTLIRQVMAPVEAGQPRHSLSTSVYHNPLQLQI
jgi:hypothetical protein